MIHRFLLVKLILDHLLELTTLREVQNALELQPFELHLAFQASLDRIDAQPPAKRKLARRLLNWITFAKRPLRIEEVICAFAVEDDIDHIRSENLVNADLLVRVCVGLVVLDENYHTVDMIHSSAYEFFQSNLSSQDADLDIAQTCLQYLTMGPLIGGPCNSARETALRLEQMEFLSYSAKHWGMHLREDHAQIGLKIRCSKYWITRTSCPVHFKFSNISMSSRVKYLTRSSTRFLQARTHYMSLLSGTLSILRKSYSSEGCTPPH